MKHVELTVQADEERVWVLADSRVLLTLERPVALLLADELHRAGELPLPPREVAA